MNRVGTTISLAMYGRLAPLLPRPGKDKGGCLVSTETKAQQRNTHNHGTYRYSVRRGTTDSSVHKTTGDKWLVPARRLTQTHFGAVVQKTGDKIPIPLRSQIDFFRFGRRAYDAAGNLCPKTTDPLDIFESVIYIHCPCPTRSGLAVG